MKVLSVLNPTLNDYKISGAASFGINLGENLPKDICTDYIASDSIFSVNRFIPENRVFTPMVSKRKSVSDTIKFALDTFKSGNYDIMHIHLHQMSVLSAINKFIPKDVPVVYTQHTSTILGRFSLGYREDAYELSTDSDRKIKIVCPSNSMFNIWKEYIGNDSQSIDESKLNNVKMIRNGVPEFFGIKPNPDLRIKSGRYISCGRIDPNKGMLELAKFCVKYKHPIILIGDIGMGTMKLGDEQLKYYNDFKNIAENNSDIILWVEYASNEDVRKLMSRSKGYISFSNKESFGLTVAEALSTGTPIFYLEEDAISEIVDNNTSVMIPRDELKRKRFDSKLEIYEKYFKRFEQLCSSKDIHTHVYSSFRLKDLSMVDCASNYALLYSELCSGR